MKNELNSRQFALYNYLKKCGDEWTHAVDIARAVYGFNGDKFIGSNAQRKIAADIQKINDSSVIQKVIMSDRTKGVKLANKEEFVDYIQKEISASLRRLIRARRKAEKGSLDNQFRIPLGKYERDYIQAYINSNGGNND